MGKRCDRSSSQFNVQPRRGKWKVVYVGGYSPLIRGSLRYFSRFFPRSPARFTFEIRVSLEIRATPRKSLATNHPRLGGVLQLLDNPFVPALLDARSRTFGKYTVTDVAVPRHVPFQSIRLIWRREFSRLIC